ncbi:MAG: class I SAM-dependent methyltransferase, partial [Flavobacteriales bacterium]
IEATDISEKQLAEAVQSDNIHYTIQPAEKTLFKEHSFDLITVAQAIHWLQFDAFYKEVQRTLKPDGALAVIGYDLCRVDDETDILIDDLYKNILGKYWDQERRYIDEQYQTIPFPFEEIRCPEFEMTHRWTLTEFMGYLSTWSALKHFRHIHKTNPLVELENQLRAIWKEEVKDVRFKILQRVGRPSNN